MSGSWVVVVAGARSQRIDDLPLEVLADIAVEHKISWYDLVRAPCAHPLAGAALVRAVAGRLGVAAPESFTARTLLDSFVPVDDDLPEAYTDGIPSSEAAPTID